VSELDVSFLRNIGCCDNSCHFIPPTGAGTNGGCRCLKDLSGGRSMNHSLLVLGPILKQVPDEIDRLRNRNERLKKAINEVIYLLDEEDYVLIQAIKLLQEALKDCEV